MGERTSERHTFRENAKYNIGKGNLKFNESDEHMFAECASLQILRVINEGVN